MAQKDPWAEFEEVAPGSSGPTLTPVISLPDPDKAADNARADRGQVNNDITTGIAVREEGHKAEDRIFNRENTFRDEFQKLPQVKEYQTVIRQYDAALKTQPTPQGDQALITAYAKMLDPGSVVREQEFNTVAAGDSTIGQAAARLGKELGLDGNGLLRPEVRDRVRREMLNLVKGYNQSYNQVRQDYTALAERSGVNPANVIGTHYGQTYLPAIQSALEGKQQDRQQQPVPGVNTPTMRGGLPEGTPIQFGMDGGDDAPFDRDAALRARGIPGADGEAAITAFWNANRGNPNLTAEGAAQWYQSQGIPAPDPASLQKSVDDAKAGYQFGGVDLTAEEEAYRQALQSRLDQSQFNPEDTQEYLRRAGVGASMGLNDEYSGIQAFRDALLAGKNPTDAYIMARDTERLALEQMREKQGLTGDLAELGGGIVSGILLPGGSAKTAAGAAKTGAAYGAAAGFGYGDGFADSVTDAALGGAAGAGLGYGAGRIAEGLAGRSAARAGRPLTEGGEVIQAADNLNQQFGTNIRPIPADVSGPGIRNATGGAAKLPLAAQPIVKGAERVTAEAQKARDAIAAMAGTPGANPEAAGEAAINGAQNYIKRSKTKVDALYEKARRLGGDVVVDMRATNDALQRNIMELADTPGGAPAIEKLRQLQQAVDRGEFSVEGVRRMRTQLRDQFMSEGLRGSDLERRVGQVIDAADDDIADSLVNAGRADAAKAYSEAAAAHKERVGVIDSVLEPIIGKTGDKSGEQAMTAIATATKQNNARLGKFLNSIPAEDAATIRATLISSLGKASKGTQDAEGSVFSLPQFLTHWNDISPQAKATLFGGELRAALDDLARVAQGTKEAQKFANFSNTGSSVGLVGTGAAIPGFFYAPITTTVALASQYGGGKLLSSPKFARWLAKMPAAAGRPQTLSNHIANLSKIAANDTAIAADITGLREALERALTQPLKAAAGPGPGAGTQTEIETGEGR